MKKNVKEKQSLEKACSLIMYLPIIVLVFCCALMMFSTPTFATETDNNNGGLDENGALLNEGSDDIQEDNLLASGICGDNTTWELYESGELFVLGEGDMDSFSHPNNSSPVPWYDWRAYIKRCTLGESVTSIGSCAFYGCVNLIEVEGGDNIKSIGGSAFHSCSSLEYFNIPDDTTFIGMYAFNGCESITSINIPQTITEINDNVFYGCTSLESVQIPDSVTSIGVYSFACCSNLKNISFSKNLKSIGHDAFLDNSSLECIDLPEGLEIIGNDAFEGCVQLSEIVIPDSVQTYGRGIFGRCSNLTEVTMPYSTFDYIPGTPMSIAPIGWLFGNQSYDGCDKTVQSYEAKAGSISLRTGNFYIPTKLKKVTITKGSVSLYAFQNCTNIEEIIIGDGVSEINKYAFVKCSRLKEITISSSVNGIYEDVFGGCSSLEKLTMPYVVFKTKAGGLATFGYLFGTSDYNGSVATYQKFGEGSSEKVTYFVPASLKEVTITRGAIAPAAFQNCKNIDTLIIGDGVSEIGSSAFLDCSGLKEVTISSNAVFAENGPFSPRHPAFYGCSSVESIEVTGKGSIQYGGPWNYTEVENANICIGNGIQEISDKAFSNCPWITSIELPSSIEIIGTQAFSNCYNLSNITIPNGVTSISDYTFSGCNRLSTISLPERIRSIGSFAFSDCSSLKNISLPKTLDSIGSYAFYKDESLEGIEIPSNVKTIDEYTFSGCIKLAKVTIPNELETISTQAFSHCYNLREIILPKAMVKIGDSAFENCSRLLTVRIYKNGNGQNISEDNPSLGAKAFANCSSLTQVELPSNVTMIGDYAFSQCSRLSSVILPNSSKIIGDAVFYKCTCLKSIVIPKKINSIPDGFLSGNASINSIYLECNPPDVITKAFSSYKGTIYYNCTNKFWNATERSLWSTSATWKQKHTRGNVVKTVKPTCLKKGYTSYRCSKCQKILNDKYVSAKGHRWKHIKNAAGYLKNGSEYDQCTACKAKKNSKTLPGYSTYYVKSFKVAKAKKAFTAKWKKQSKANLKKFDGYQIRYSTKSNMSGAKYTTAGKKSKSKKIKGLAKKTKYYVQVRTYTKSGGTTFYSKWSAKKTVKTK